MECDLNDWDAVDKLYDCMMEGAKEILGGRKYYIPIRMEANAWGSGLKHNAKLLTPNGIEVFTQERHQDPRGAADYEILKKYM